MSVALELRLDGAAAGRLARFQEAVEAGIPGLLDDLGGVVVAQTRLRFQDEKRDPAGDDWKSWSDAYAARRPAGKSLLMDEGDLEESIEAFVSGDDLAVGSAEPHAATHQFGDEGEDRLGRRRNMPARAYLGISADNAAELDAEIGDWLAETARRAG